MESSFNDSTATDTIVAKREPPTASKAIRKSGKKSSASKKNKSGGRSAGGRIMGSSQGSQGEGGSNKKKKPRKEAFSMYIYKVLKQVHPDKGITTSSMQIMNSMIIDLMERISAESAKLLMLNKKSTLGARDIQTACKLVIRGELASHAVSEGTKAIATYDRNKEK